MKVLYVDNSLGFGGAIKSLALTFRGLPSIEKVLATSQDDDLLRLWFPSTPVRRFRRLFNYRTKDRLFGARVRPLRWIGLKAFAAADLAASVIGFVRVFWILRRDRIDLVHLNNGFLPFEVMLAARAARVPYVVHLRDFHRQPDALKSRTVRAAARVFPVSDAVGSSLESVHFGPGVIVTIYDPVDGPAVLAGTAARDRIRRDCGLPDSAIAVGIFGRVIPWKGQLEFVRAAATAMAANEDIYAVIVGDQSDGAADYFDRVKSFIAQTAYTERFILAGYRENVEEYYAAMDIVVHASITPEPFGMVVPEAMAAARAVIAADAGGPREIITHGSDGLLVPPADVAKLANAIQRLAQDPSERMRLATSAQQTALKRFSIDANANQIANEYAKVLGMRRLETPCVQHDPR